MKIDTEKYYIDVAVTAAGAVILSAVVFAVKGARYLPTAVTLSALLLCIAQTDMVKGFIPNRYVLLMAVPAVLNFVQRAAGGEDVGTLLVSRLVGFFICSVPLLAAAVLTRGAGVGGGDIKLMAAAGVLLGASRVVYAFLIGTLAVIPAIIFNAVRSMATQTEKRKQYRMGPFLAAGIWIVYLIF